MTRHSRRPTLRDVAARAGVSQSTVSIVLSGRRSGADRISAATRQQVMVAVEALGYVPNQAARGLRRQATERVCLAYPILGAPYNDLMAADLRTIAAEHGYSVVIQMIPPDIGPTHTLEEMRAGLADGLLLVHDPDETLAAELAEVARMGIAIMVMSNLAHGTHFDVVHNDEYATSAAALDYLVELGHTRIAYIRHEGTRLRRYDAFCDRMQAHGLSIVPEYLLFGANTREKAFAATEKMLALPEPPTAIFAGSDRAAISAMWAIQHAGLRIPDDIAVLGVGNIPEGELTYPRLTSVGPASRDFMPVINQLFDRIQGNAPEQGQTLTMPWHLVVRGST